MGSLSSFLVNKQDIDMSKNIENKQDTKNHLQDKLPIGDVVFSEAECKHPRNKRIYIGENMLRCTLCGKEFK